MFAYILNKARNIASTPVMRKVLKIRMLGSLAKNIQSRLYPLVYCLSRNWKILSFELA